MIHENVIHKTLAKIPNVSDEEAHMTTESLIHVNDTAIQEIIENMATKADIKDMATKADIKDMATKADIKDMVTKADIKDMATKADIMDTKLDIANLKVEISNLETRMMRQQLVHTGVVIASLSTLILLIKFFS